jgi:hypothetical protein
LRAGKSKAVDAAAILGLIVLTVLMFDAFDTSNLFNPTAPRTANPTHNSPPPPTGGPNGTLVILVTSNQNTTNRFAPPTNASSGAEGVPVLATFAEATTLSAPAEYSWTTNSQGLTGCIQCLPAGLYVVSIRYDGLSMTIPTSVFAGNQTFVQVNFTGKAYPLTYSEDWGILVTPRSVQSTMFAKVSSSAPVANVSQPVFLTVLGSASAPGYSVNATVVSEGALAMGTQWLQLGTPSPVNLYDAASISLTVWTSSTTTTVGPITYSTASLKQ